MTHQYLLLGQQSSRSALEAKLREHDDALNALEALAPPAATVTNADAVTLPVGTPVYLFSSGQVKRALATAAGTARVIGLVVQPGGIAASATGAVALVGLVTLTTAQWDAVAGTSGGLTPGAIYYLSDATSGRLATPAPSAAGHFDTEVLFALSSTQAALMPRVPIPL